jgi:3-deoxy-D-manno-octulosonate 8-phosphate phosphatase (KDO 8-P phosphatase)
VQQAGIQTAIITGRVSPMVARRATELGIHHVIQGREDKLTALKELLRSVAIELHEVAYMGDDLPDVDAIAKTGLGACPKNAVSAVTSKADWVASHNGGEGCVREFCDYLLGDVNS